MSPGSDRPHSLTGPERGPAATAEILLLAFLPGCLVGTHVAGLLFFLNPSLPFEPVALARGVGVCGLIFGLLSLAVLGPVTWRRRHRARRILPWSITTALVLAALGYWVHASLYSYFLPPGINIRMIKAALWLSFGALICFYTALLHSMSRSRYGRRSRYGLTLLALASVYLMVERREAFNPRPGAAPMPSSVELEQQTSLFVIGLQGATLDAVLPLARQGQLPFFARLIEEGTYARLQSYPPTRDGALWTSLVTGKFPFKHGIVGDTAIDAGVLAPQGFLRLLPAGGTPLVTLGGAGKATDATFRDTSTIWELLSRLGFATGIVGWPSSFPVGPRPGFAFSDRYFQGDFSREAAYPVELAERGELFRVKAEEMDTALTDRFGDQVHFSILEALAQDHWRLSLTQFLLDQRRDVRVIFVTLPGLGEVSRRDYGGYAAVHFDGAQGVPQQAAAQTVIAYYRLLDQQLAALWQRETGPRLWAIVSAYGFEGNEGWQTLWGLMTGTALRGRSGGAPDGLLLLAGGPIRAGGLLDSAELVDVMPTLLYGLGLPVARDLDGRVLTAAFESSFLARHPLTFVPSYETLELPTLPTQTVVDPIAAITGR